MSKRRKTKVFSFQGFDLAHYKATEAYTRAVSALFDKATDDIANAASRENYNPDKPFSFDDYPKAKAQLQKTIKGLAGKMQAVIETASRKQWLFACQKNDEFIASIFDTTKLTKGQLKKYQDRNLDALQSFQQRKVGGLDLSERVWKYTQQYKEQIEVGLDVGLGEGRSAQQLSRDLRQNLKDPNRLFRRVRDKRGNLQLSKSAKAFHPGQGVYRSSYKNAMRLARSEINMSYRESDHLRWQQLDFVLGFEVHRSNREPKCNCELCERLVGRYPKWFKFKGWHPQCLCYAIPILEDFYSKERSDDRVARMRAALRGEEYKKYVSKALIKDLPDNFKEWASENEERQKNWASTPYFIKDNFVDGDLSKGLMYIQKPKPLTLLEKAAIRHENRTPEQAQAIQARWDERSASRLIAKSEEIKDEVQAFAVSVAAEFGGRVTPVNLKTRASIIRKLGTAEVNHDAREIKDAVRTTIMVDSDKVDGVRSYFKQIKSSGGNVQRIKVQAGSVFLGYTGTIVNINGANGLTAEIQVNTPKMIYAKEPPEDAKRIIGEALWRKIQRETGLPGGLGHKYYEQYRSLTYEQQRSELGREIARKSEEYYSHFTE
nr:MAG TPA: minor capsid protein [Caudoviricetes sp.]